jgi:hypothetical protein
MCIVETLTAVLLLTLRATYTYVTREYNEHNEIMDYITTHTCIN